MLIDVSAKTLTTGFQSRADVAKNSSTPPHSRDVQPVVFFSP